MCQSNGKELQVGKNDQSINKAAKDGKIFMMRESPLTTIMANPNNKAIVNMVIAAYLTLLITTFSDSLMIGGKWNFGLRAFVYGFGKFHYFLPIWLVLFLLNLLVYGGFSIWAKIHKKISTVHLRKLNNTLFLSLLIFYYCGTLWLASIFTIRSNLPPLTSLCILLEEIRFLMKAHAFVRSSAPLILKYKFHGDDEPHVPTFQKYLYFSFAPTLIFSETYPRTSKVRWSFVFQNILGFCFALHLLSLIYERYLNDFDTLCPSKISWLQVLIYCFKTAILGFATLFFFGFVMLHSWLNAFAEVLTFGDRLFYMEYWKSESMMNYHRLWNIIVQDWLYFYVYKDFYDYLVPKSRMTARIMVILISSAFHEYVLIVCLGLFFPFNFFSFFCSTMVMMHLTTKPGNLYYLFNTGHGFSAQIVMYTIAYYTTLRCPLEYESFWDYFQFPNFACGCVDRLK